MQERSVTSSTLAETVTVTGVGTEFRAQSAERS